MPILSSAVAASSSRLATRMMSLVTSFRSQWLTSAVISKMNAASSGLATNQSAARDSRRLWVRFHVASQMTDGVSPHASTRPASTGTAKPIITGSRVPARHSAVGAGWGPQSAQPPTMARRTASTTDRTLIPSTTSTSTAQPNAAAATPSRWAAAKARNVVFDAPTRRRSASARSLGPVTKAIAAVSRPTTTTTVVSRSSPVDNWCHRSCDRGPCSRIDDQLRCLGDGSLNQHSRQQHHRHAAEGEHDDRPSPPLSQQRPIQRAVPRSRWRSPSSCA